MKGRPMRTALAIVCSLVIGAGAAYVWLWWITRGAGRG